MRRRALLALAVVVLAGACGDPGPPEAPRVDPDTGAPLPTSVVSVYAASSLTEAFEDIGARFSEDNPGVRVDFTFAASDLLLAEIERGKPAAVLATADDDTMRLAVEADHARDPQPFARNHLALVVARGNPKGIDGVGALGRDDVRFGVCDPIVPCGLLAGDVLGDAGVGRAPASTRESARQLLGELRDGELDAALVYSTTAALDPEVQVAADLLDRVTEYEISLLAGAVDREGATAFVAFVRSAEGQSVLEDRGFEPL
ncbi:MAG TPA: molybdate ABC transporter substrate-binding protein [Acidimicrobiales bacterium]|nr:molybdate ABC transporter substrate-binding protein [Acidimicrobiales bacterium]